MRGNKVEKCFSLKELNDKAKAAPVESTPIRFYIRSAEQLFKQVHFNFVIFVFFSRAAPFQSVTVIWSND